MEVKLGLKNFTYHMEGFSS